jgi:hypothetical protein
LERGANSAGSDAECVHPNAELIGESFALVNLSLPVVLIVLKHKIAIY